MAKKAKGGAGLGAGILAAASVAGAAAGYYFYASKDATKHRRIAVKWAKDMKNDVIKKAKKLENLDRKDMMKVVDEISKTYENVRGLNKESLTTAVKELKANWENLRSEVTKGGKKSVASAKKTVKKSVAKKGVTKSKTAK